MSLPKIADTKKNTSVDKALYQLPQSIEDEAAQDTLAGLEIEILDPEENTICVAGADGTGGINEEDAHGRTFDENIAEYMSEGGLAKLAGDLNSDADNDRMARADWEKTYKEGLKLMGLQYEDRTEPWDGACGVFHPMITEAVVRFQSEAITEMFPAQGPVKAKIIGKETPDKIQAARRVEEDLNHELTDVMREFRPEHERMLWSLPATGSAFKKVYYDPSLGRQTSVFVPAEDMLLPYGATDMDTCYRVTHELRKTKNDIRKLQQAGFYIGVALPDANKSTTDIQRAKDKETGFSDINDERYVLLEMHVDIDLNAYTAGVEEYDGVGAVESGVDVDADVEGTGIACPYVITIIKGTSVVLAVRRNWKEEDERRIKRQHFVHYQYIPGFGAYGFGLFHLIGGFAKSATSLMRQLVDAGTLSNLPGGLKARGLRIKGDDTPIAPGEFRDVDLGSGALRDNILPLPYKEPSTVLYQLLGNIVEEGRRFAATADMKVADMSANAPVGTTLALLERQLKVMSAVQARMHYALKQELKLLAAIIRDYTDDTYSYKPDYGTIHAKKDDYDQVSIIPVSDPNAATMSQRVIQYQAVIQLAQMAPDIYDLPQLHRQMLDVLGIKNAEKLVPLPDDQKPRDPVSENMAVLKGTPVKAFQHQDHEAHIKVHLAATQDPIIMQIVGQNPRAASIQNAMMSHVAEHVGFAYRQKIEQQLGMSLAPDDEDTKMPVEVEIALSGMMAQAAQQVLQQSQQTQAQQQAQQQAQDPLVQMQQAELQLRGREVDIKEKKLQTDAAAEADRIALEEKKLNGHLELEAMKLGVTIKQTKHKMAADQERDGVRMGIDIAKQQQLAASNNMKATPNK